MWRLIVKEIMASKKEVLLGSLSLSLASLLIALFASIIFGTFQVLMDKFSPNLPANLVAVEAQQSESLIFNLLQHSQGQNKHISEGQLNALGKLSGVEKVWPRLEIKVPMVASGGSAIFGSSMATDLFASGLPAELLEATGELPEAFFDEAGADVPIIISPVLLAMYNQTVAPALGALPLAFDQVKGLAFTLTLGKSYMLGQQGPVGKERCFIAGKSPLATTLGFSVPLETARRWLEIYAPKNEPLYSMAYLKLRAGTSRTQLQEQLQTIGLDFDADSRRAAEIQTIIVAVVAIFSLCLLILSLLNISQAISHIVARRRPTLYIMSCCGASWPQLGGIVLGQAIFCGLCGASLGLIICGIILKLFKTFIVVDNSLLSALGFGALALSAKLVIIVLLAGILTAFLAAVPAVLQCRSFYGRSKTDC